jgi:glycosyltransferase involved in cell wall biosynthesis
MAKTLIIHDRFQFRGGAERLVLDLANILEADIVTEFWTETTYPKSAVPHGLTVLDSGEPRIMVARYLRAQWNFWWKTRKLIKSYDTIIFSGNNCLAAALRPLPGKRVVAYCHTPVRYVYDLFAARRKAEVSALKRVAYYDIGKWLIRGMYRLGLSRMQTVVTNSQNVHDRLLRFCHRDSRVIYPPIHTEKFVWKGQGDYYLSFARLDSLKRVDDIVRAFQKMPDKKLIIASGGDDEQKIRDLARGYENISVIGWVDDEKLKELVGNCIANIYIPVNEDFGMTAVEGMAAGKPCIGVDEGGLRETIEEGKTGVRIAATYAIDDIVHAVRNMTPERALAIRSDCEYAAQRFSVARFEREIREALHHPESASGKIKVAVDASRSIVSPKKTGVEVVSDELLKRMSLLKDSDITFYTPQEIPWLPKKAQHIIARHHFWTIIGLSLAMLRHKPDALFIPVHTLPFFCPKKTVRIIHDVSFLRHPQAYSLRERTYMKLDLWRAKRICSSVIVPAEAVKRDLIELLDWDADRIVVTGWGIPSKTLSAGSVPGTTENPFILFIGRVEEKKNVANIIRAFEIFHKAHPHWELVLAGKPGYGFEAIEHLLATPGVRYLGYVSEEKKAELLAEASSLALISHEEGFAFPMLEAFQARVPVLASSIPTLTEIAEDAALFAEPTNVATIAQNMACLADSPALCEEFIKRGEEKLKKYSWDAVIQKVLKTLVY